MSGNAETGDNKRQDYTDFKNGESVVHPVAFAESKTVHGGEQCDDDARRGGGREVWDELLYMVTQQ